MKKKIIFGILIFLGVFLFAENSEYNDDEYFYIVSKEELGYFLQSYNWLKKWEAGEIKVSDKEFSELYEEEINQKAFSSMLYENFFRNTNNKEIQKQVKKYIKKNKINDNPFEKTLLKKYASKSKEREQGGKKIIQYSYQGKEFDENINLFNFSEIHPFNDEFGLLLFRLCQI